jgi:hypothetical protein
MFGKRKASRFADAVARKADALPSRVSALTPPEQANVLLLANCVARLVAGLHGAAVVDAPGEAGEKAAQAALAALSAASDDLERLRASEETSPEQKKNSLYHLLATDLVFATVGLAVAPGARRKVAEAWFHPWGSRKLLTRAVAWVRRCEAETGVPAVPAAPDGSVWSDLDLIRLGNSVPSFLRKKK